MSTSYGKGLALVALAALFSFATSAPVASATAQDVVYLETNCDADVSLTANVGDTIVITMVHPGCNGSAGNDDPAGNFANFNNLNGTYFYPEPYNGTATGAGFLDYVSHTGGTNKDNDYWNIQDSNQDDWYVMQSEDGGENVVITATLRATDGNGDPLVVGSYVADIYTEAVSESPIEFAVTYAGPRAATGLADTGTETVPTASVAFLALVFGALTIAFTRRSRVVAARTNPRA